MTNPEVVVEQLQQEVGDLKALIRTAWIRADWDLLLPVVTENPEIPKTEVGPKAEGSPQKGTRECQCFDWNRNGHQKGECVGQERLVEGFRCVEESLGGKLPPHVPDVPDL